MATKMFLCNGCMKTMFLDDLDDQHKCPYCGSLELEHIEGGSSSSRTAPRGTYKGDEDIWGNDGNWWST